MYDRMLQQMRACIRARRYMMTLHAEEEMDNDSLSIFDVEHGILTGEIVERQRDRDTAEWKYLVEGRTLAGDSMLVVVGRISTTSRLVIVTVYRV